MKKLYIKKFDDLKEGDLIQREYLNNLYYPMIISTGLFVITKKGNTILHNHNYIVIKHITEEFKRKIFKEDFESTYIWRQYE